MKFAHPSHHKPSQTPNSCTTRIAPPTPYTHSHRRPPFHPPAPMNAPPAMDASVPAQDMPPLVPRGTRRRKSDVTSRGECGDRIPSSDALPVRIR
jgi:hypothetical protein